ncbi:MAG: class I SAM-dependent methyltransferase [Saprospiraceae bacterium]|nr:class I SAM-dependent methyltransferase [Saprospiraceae bacterium]
MMHDHAENIIASIKKIISLAVSPRLVDVLLMVRYKMKSSPFKSWDHLKTFREIYISNHWKSDESVSGPGSVSEITENLIHFINDLILEKNIQTVLDLPCGDFSWMKNLNFDHIDYLGADIVPELIDANELKYASENIHFQQLDIISNHLPSYDLLICRDCLPHFSFDHILKALQNIKNSGCTYLLTTQYSAFTRNFDIVTGDWRPINLCIKPFDLAAPMLSIEEYYPKEYRRQSRGKKLALWRIDQL